MFERLFVGATLLFFCAGASAAGPVALPDMNAQYNVADYRAINAAAGSSQIVALGESIHLTREMPSVRLGIVRSLHENNGFRALALEGALMNVWTAQEKAYASKAPLDVRAHEFTRQALFGLWQTDQMERVVAYALATQSGANPLYLASFDIQPGSARAFNGSAAESVRSFLQTGRSRGAELTDAQLESWVGSLGPALGCKQKRADHNSLAALSAWINGPLATALTGKRPTLHLQTLRLVPAMLQHRLEQCQTVTAGGSYQASRDAHNAVLARDLQRNAGKIILWAHHSHLHHNSLGKAVPSMGQHLRRAYGEGLYTIGLFAAGGNAVDSVRADKANGPGIVFALAARPVPGEDRFAIEKRLASLLPADFFLDLRANSSNWSSPSRSRLEVDGSMSTALSRDFDGAILLHKVSAAELNFLPRPFQWGVTTAGWLLQHAVLAALLSLLAIGGLTWIARKLGRSILPRAEIHQPKSHKAYPG